MPPPQTDRVDAPQVADERTALTTWLDYQRATLLQKCDGLTGEQLARTSVPPSGLSLHGLVLHMLLVEWWWFDHIFTGSTTPEPLPTGDDPEWEFTHLVAEEALSDQARLVAQCEMSRSIVEAADNLDVLARSDERGTLDLRWILIHMIEEYARHNGHADLLREAIDGVVGD
jgi:uncharacterized damage-inducible protein DinB